MASLTNPIRQFLDDAPWSIYCGARYSFVAIERPDGLHNLACRIVFETDACPDGSYVESEGHGLRARCGWLPIEAARQLLEGFGGGSLVFGGEELQFRSTDNGAEYGSWWVRSTLEESRARLDWPALEAVGSGSAIHAVLRPQSLFELSARLHSMSPLSFESWNRLAQYVGRGTEFSDSRSTLLEIYAPVYARLGQPAIDRKSRVVRIVVESLVAPGSIDLSVRVTRVPGVGVAPPSELLVLQPHGRDLWVAIAQFQPDTRALTIQLGALGRCAESLTLDLSGPPSP